MTSNVFVLLLQLLAMCKDVAGEDKIVGGTVVSPTNKYPFIVALLEYPDAERPVCGGTLVDPNWVLSAAHCWGWATHVAIGRFDLTDSSEDYELIEIDWSTNHPEYDDSKLDNDFMMIRLKTNSSYTPIELDDGAIGNLDGKAVTTMGWGTTSSGGEASDKLLEVEVDVITTDTCNEQYGGSITTNMLCAARDGKDSCQGDSGGPLILEDENILVGVVSWGKGCAEPSYAGVYAKVSSRHEWIQNEIANGVRPDDIWSDWFPWDDDYFALYDDNPIYLIWILIRTFIDNFLFYIFFGENYYDDYDN